VTGMPYIKCRKYLKAFGNIGKANNRRISNGVFKDDMDIAMESLGWFYTKMPKTPKAFCFDMPKDITILCNMPGHFVAIQNGIIQDTFDSSNKRIYGYWQEIT